MLDVLSDNQEKKTFVSLLSTGLDSPVATYLIMRQGYDCFSLSFLNGNEKAFQNKNKIIKMGYKLVELTSQKLTMHFMNYDSILSELKQKVNNRLICVLCKRIMVKTAVKLAKNNNIEIIINGDILGEQASQTLDNLYVIHQVNKEIPIIRPLIGFNKLDVIKISQKVGLYPISIKNGPSCTFNPKFPETRANLGEVKFNEDKLEDLHIVNKIIKNLEKYEIK